MGALDFLREFQGRVLDAASYQLLLRNYELQEKNNQLMKDQIEHLEKELSVLRNQNSQLAAEHKDLLTKVKEFELEKQYKIHEGIAFKLKQDGGVEPTPYCPNCHLAMSNGIRVCKCPQCGYIVRTSSNADVLARELNAHRD